MTHGYDLERSVTCARTNPSTVEAIQTGRLNPGDQIVFVGFGAGLTWGALAAQWSGPLPEEVPLKAVWPYRFERLYRVYVLVRSKLLQLIRRIEGLI